MLFLIHLIMCIITVTAAVPLAEAHTPYNTNDTLIPTRRILKGHTVGDTKPYMVYLRGAPLGDAKSTASDWICGGVIIHERYILTSAACIEDVKHFYIISGTSKWIPLSDNDNECIKNGAKKAIWKCVPKSYVYDGEEFDNIRWMVGDIAVVKVEEDFNFEKRVRGCDFVPKKVAYNNQSADLEKSRSYASIAGWGTTETFSDVFDEKAQLRQSSNSHELLEAEVQLISGKNCKKRWDSRYHYVIDEHMVCTKDITDDEAISGICADREINCKELQYTDSDDYEDDDEDQKSVPKHPKPPPFKRMMVEPGQLKVHTGGYLYNTRKKNKVPTGGFCQNDHGGPLIVGQGKTSMVIGVMSACLTRDVTRQCYGPFLFTSVFRYRNLITCAIDKNLGSSCRKLLRTSKTPMEETYFDWSIHNDKSLHTLGQGVHKNETKPVPVPAPNSRIPNSKIS